MKKLYFFTLTIMCVLTLSSCGGGSNSADQERIAQLEAQIAQLQNNNENTVNEFPTESFSESNHTTEDKSPSTNFAGTYKFTDEAGSNWTIVVKDDNSAQVSVDGGDVVYCEWENYNYYENTPNILRVMDWSDGRDERQKVKYKESVNRFNNEWAIYDGFVYADVTAVKSKNPNLRLPVKKINKDV